MRTLSQYLTQDHIDGHVHLFDHNGIIDQTLINKSYKCVCFADITFRYHSEYDGEKVIKYYDDFIYNHYDPQKHILLATGIDANTIIKLYKKYPQFIKGFGELKCYDRWKEGELPYGNLEWIKPVLDFNRSLNLPVYIHFNLDTIERRVEFEELLKQYSTMPIVLCHAGMVDKASTNTDIHMFVLNLLNIYNNLYVDLSFLKTQRFYINNVNRLLQLPVDRVIIGSDINPIIKEVLPNPNRYSKHCYSNLNKLTNILKCQNTIYKLFNISNNKVDKLISIYQNKLNTLTHHSQMHVLARGNLIGMFNYGVIEGHLIEDANVLNDIIDDYINGNYDSIVNTHVLIGYTQDTRKRKIGKLFKSVDQKYKKYLCLITILEMAYVFVRMKFTHLIHLNKIRNIIKDNLVLLSTCIIEDKYDFKTNAATKYINSLFFIKNLTGTFACLKDVVTDDIYTDIIHDYIELYNKRPDVTTIYGITHILIGSSHFYTKRPDNIYKPLIDILYSVAISDLFNTLTFDLQMEILLCCKLFGKDTCIDLTNKVKLTQLEKYEHTNMLYILLNKHNIN